MSALAAREDAARFVGGAVRNALLGEPVTDVDIATRFTPDEVVRRLEAAGLRAVATGIEHGTVTAIADGKPFEVTSLRRDVETFGRRAVVAYTTDVPAFDSRWGKPFLLGPGNIHVAHTNQERISKKELLAASEIYQQMVKKLLAGA